MDLNVYFGAAVRIHREQAGISQEELAHRAALDRTYISGIERGVRNPSLRNIGRIADALGIDVQTLFVTAARVRSENQTKER